MLRRFDDVGYWLTRHQLPIQISSNPGAPEWSVRPDEIQHKGVRRACITVPVPWCFPRDFYHEMMTTYQWTLHLITIYTQKNDWLHHQPCLGGLRTATTTKCAATPMTAMSIRTAKCRNSNDCLVNIISLNCQLKIPMKLFCNIRHIDRGAIMHPVPALSNGSRIIIQSVFYYRTCRKLAMACHPDTCPIAKSGTYRWISRDIHGGDRATSSCMCIACGYLRLLSTTFIRAV